VAGSQLRLRLLALICVVRRLPGAVGACVSRAVTKGGTLITSSPDAGDRFPAASRAFT
jgi:hypothetical protein